MTTRCTECATSAETIEGLQELLFDPPAYRAAYRENMEIDYPGDEPKAEIFVVLKKQIVAYAKANPDFKKYLMSSLGGEREPSRSRPRPTTQSYTPRLRSAMIYNPRSSSRPTLD